MLLVAVLIALTTTQPTKPEILLPPTIRSPRDDIIVQVRVMPHPRIQTVTLEAWEVGESRDLQNTLPTDEAPEITEAEKIIRRSSTQDYAGEKVIVFNWMPLSRGSYFLKVKLQIGRGVYLTSRSYRLEVR